MNHGDKFYLRGPIQAAAVFVLAIAFQGAAVVSLEPWSPDARSLGERSYAYPQDAITSTFLVVNNYDSGDGSLRQAILDANQNPGRDAITFGFFEPVTATIQLLSPLPEITESVSIVGGFGIPTVSIDAASTAGDLFTISITNQIAGVPGPEIRGLRLLNVSDNAFSVISSTHTLLDGNVIVNGGGGVMIGSGGHFTIANNVLDGMSRFGIRVSSADNLSINNNVITGTKQANAVELLDAVKVASVISNTLVAELGDGVVAEGSPAPIGIQIRNNLFNVAEGAAIHYGPGVNFDFPAPKIAPSMHYSDTPLLLYLGSDADPGVFTYPLSVDVYRVRNHTFEPAGTITYTADQFPEASRYIFTPTIPLAGDDLLTAIATTSNPSTSEFSDPQPILTGLAAEVDIKPGSDPNSIKCDDENGTIPVAILSEPDFDALSIDHTTVRFGLVGTEASEVHTRKGTPARHEKDVDGDGLVDLVFHFKYGDTGLSCGDENGVLSGLTYAGIPYSGVDAINTVPGHQSKTDEGQTPELALRANYPNPFRESTSIGVSLPESGHVTLLVRDVLGREVSTLVDRELPAGDHTVTWYAAGYASGLYLYELHTGGRVKTGTMMLLR